MKEGNRIKLMKFPILITLLFLTSFILPASNRSTCPVFGSRSLNAISHTASITKKPEQIYITFHYELTLIFIPTHHPSQCRRHDITHHGPQGHCITRPNGTARSDHYDANGNLTTRSDFDGANWTHHYDPMNRPMSTDVDSASASASGKQTHAYDSDGNLTSTITDGRTGTMTYDALNRLASRTFENGKIVSYTYYPNGTLHTLTDNLGSTIGYQYNKSGLLDSVIDGSNQTLATYTYTDEGHIATITQPGAKTTFSYDPAGRILTEGGNGDRQIIKENACIGLAVGVE